MSNIKLFLFQTLVCICIHVQTFCRCSQFRLIALQEITPGVLESIENYLKDNAILETFVSMAPGCLKFLMNVQRSKLDEVCQKFKLEVQEQKRPNSGFGNTTKSKFC